MSNTPTQLLQVPFGTDQIFSLLFDYSKAALLEDPKRANIHSETPDDLDLREAKNLRVALESTLGFGGVPTWRITERDGRWNVLTIELNAPDQSLGTWWANVSFDLVSDRFEDGLYHQTRRIPLCRIVPAETLQTVRPFPRPDHVLLLSSGSPVLPVSAPYDGRNLIVYSRLASGKINRSNIEPFKQYRHEPNFLPIAPGQGLRITRHGFFDGYKEHSESYGQGYYDQATNVWWYDEDKKPIIQARLTQAMEFYGSYGKRSAMYVTEGTMIAPPRTCFFRYDLPWSWTAFTLELVDPTLEVPTPRPEKFVPSPEDVKARYPFPEVVNE